MYHKEILRTPPRRSNTDSASSSKGADMSPGSMARQRQLAPCPIPENMVVSGPQMGPGQVIFAVASYDQVPPGAYVLNPQTGRKD